MTEPWVARFRYINQRCNDKNCKQYRYYGKKGIKNFLTKEDIKFLWFRDKAYLLKKPSIDRIDVDGNYDLKNCRFIELSQNCRRNVKNKQVCNHGHKMTVDNLYINKKGRRVCRICTRKFKREWDSRNKEFKLEMQRIYRKRIKENGNNRITSG